jgi:hypothetical protein
MIGGRALSIASIPMRIDYSTVIWSRCVSETGATIQSSPIGSLISRLSSDVCRGTECDQWIVVCGQTGAGAIISTVSMHKDRKLLSRVPCMSESSKPPGSEIYTGSLRSISSRLPLSGLFRASQILNSDPSHPPNPPSTKILLICLSASILAQMCV